MGKVAEPTTQFLLPHSLDVAPIDPTTFDPAHSPVHHSVTPRAQLLKPAGVRATTANAPPPSYSTVPPGCSLHAFLPLAVDDVVAAVRALPDKQSADDPLPTYLTLRHLNQFRLLTN